MRGWIVLIAVVSFAAILAASPGPGKLEWSRWEINGSAGHGWIEMASARGDASTALSALALEIEAEGFEVRWSVAGESGVLMGHRGPSYVRGLYLAAEGANGFFIVQRGRAPVPSSGRTVAGDLPLYPGATVTLSTSIRSSRILAYHVDSVPAERLRAFVEDRLSETGWRVASEVGSSREIWNRGVHRLVVDFDGSNVVFLEEKVG